jgi:hypothetical protein
LPDDLRCNKLDIALISLFSARHRRREKSSELATILQAMLPYEEQSKISRQESAMTIEKKSLISTLKTARKANVVKEDLSGAASVSPAQKMPVVKAPAIKRPALKSPSAKKLALKQM